MKVYTPKVMQAAEEYLFAKEQVSALELMKRAASEIRTVIKNKLRPYDAIAVLCGKGNNAGDGYELARLLRRAGHNVICISAFAAEPTAEPAHTCFQSYIAEGGRVECDIKAAIKILEMSALIIDAVFGIGFRGSIEPDSSLYRLLDCANNARAYRVAVDVPSGVRSGDGSVGNIAFVADLTVTVTAVKVGMLSYPARFFCGEIVTVDIGVPERLLDSFENPGFVPDADFVSQVLPKRPVISNKGDFGKLLCLCGSGNMTGAALLSADAALHSGVGLVTLASEQRVLDCAACRLYEPIYQPIDWDSEKSVSALLDSLPKYSAILIGCGLAQSPVKAQTVMRIIQNASAQLILDADGINMLSEHIHVLKEASKPPILTPHPGEFSRISGYRVTDINDNRIRYAVEFAEKYRCILVLKGAGTVTAAPDGRFAVNITGNAGLAKGGSGDVLAGLTAGLAAIPGVRAFDAAVSAVYLHGTAGDLLKRKISEYGMLPSQLSGEFAGLLP